MYNNDVSDVLEFFPLEKARHSQTRVIQEIDKAFKKGTKLVILEAPVGSGKSAIAMTFARAFANAHIITPRKSLQDQYYDDFHEDIVLMKGRSAYPCLFDEPKVSNHKIVFNSIEQGKVISFKGKYSSCQVGPCVDDKSAWRECKEKVAQCPYLLAIDIAQSSPIIVHNLHSFIFQVYYSAKFDKRELLVIDEAHEVEGTVRDFLTKKVHGRGPVTQEAIDQLPAGGTAADLAQLVWSSYPDTGRFTYQRVGEEALLRDKKEISEMEALAIRLLQLVREETDFGSSVVKYVPWANDRERDPLRRNYTLELIPKSLGSAVSNMLLNFADKTLMMSGTIYDKAEFCRGLGISPTDAAFIKVGSSFPKENRPIYLKDDYKVDTSYANWYENYDEVVGKIGAIMDIFHDAKGLIHAPSYKAAEELAKSLGSRVVTHGPEDFQEKLEAFYAEAGSRVFVSPVCQQGVDFKEERARFQIIVRVPYPNVSDAFMKYKLKTDYSWYNQQALVTFGQQIGRINRGEADFGATFCLDARFDDFLSRNGRKLPGWMKEAVVRE